MAESPALESIAYGTCLASDTEAMTKLLAETFTRRDPPAVAAGLTASEFEEFVRLRCPRAAAEALTIVARSAETGELVGALLTEDGASEPPEGMERLSPKFDAIFDILDQLDKDDRAGYSARIGESLHLLLLGVSERAAGRGIGRGLISACLENGARKGYRVAFTEATNRTSQHIFRELGFRERERRSYGDYRFNGRACFASIAGEGGPILMEKRLAS